MRFHDTAAAQSLVGSLVSLSVILLSSILRLWPPLALFFFLITNGEKAQSQAEE